jgi:hypothetical protein
MPQIETRVIMVQEAGKQEELIKALKVRSFGLQFISTKEIFLLSVVNIFIVFLILC